MPDLRNDFFESYKKQKNNLERMDSILNALSLVHAVKGHRNSNPNEHEAFLQTIGLNNDSVNVETENAVEEMQISLYNRYSKNFHSIAEMHKQFGIMESKLALEMGREIKKQLSRFPEEDPNRLKKATYLAYYGFGGFEKIRAIVMVKNNFMSNFEKTREGVPVLFEQEVLRRNKTIQTITMREFGELCGFTEKNKDYFINHLGYTDENGNRVTPGPDETFGQYMINKKTAQIRRNSNNPNATLTEDERRIATGFDCIQIIANFFKDGWVTAGREAGEEWIPEKDRAVYTLGAPLLDVGGWNEVDAGPEEYQQWIEQTGSNLAKEIEIQNMKKMMQDQVRFFSEQKRCDLGPTIKIQESFRPLDIGAQSIDGSIERLQSTLDKKIKLTATNLTPFEDLMKSMILYQGAIKMGDFASADEYKLDVIMDADDYLRSFNALPRGKEKIRFDNVMTVLAVLDGKIQAGKTCRNRNQAWHLQEGAADYLKPERFLTKGREDNAHSIDRERILSRITVTDNPEEKRNLCVDYLKINYKPVLGSEEKLTKYDGIIRSMTEAASFDTLSGKELADWLRQESDYLVFQAQKAEKAAEIAVYKDHVNHYKYGLGNVPANAPVDANQQGLGRPLINLDREVQALEDAELWYGSREYSKIRRDLASLNEEIKDADNKYDRTGVQPGRKLFNKQEQLLARIDSYIQTRAASIGRQTAELSNRYLRSHNGDPEGMREYLANELANANRRYQAMVNAKNRLQSRMEFDRNAPTVTAKDVVNNRQFVNQNKRVKTIYNNLRTNQTGQGLVEQMKRAEETEREYRLSLLKSAGNQIDQTYQAQTIYHSMLRSMYLDGLLKTHPNEVQLRDALCGDIRSEMTSFAKKTAATPFGKQLSKKINEFVQNGRMDNRTVFEMRDDILRTIGEEAGRNRNFRAVNRINMLSKALGSGIQLPKPNQPANPNRGRNIHP